MDILGIDLETFSAANIRNGAAAYAEHPTTGVHCAVLILSRPGQKDRVCQWTPGSDLPAWVVRHIGSGRPLLAHNASFEHSVIGAILAPIYNWPMPRIEQWHDTAATAAAHGLPARLEGLAKVLGADVLKDEEGNALMRRFMKEDGGEKIGPRELDRLMLYCLRDVQAMLSCWHKLPRLTPFERTLQKVDLRINARGVYLDQKLAIDLRRAGRLRELQLGELTWEETGDLHSVTAAPVLKRYLEEAGVELPKAKRANGKISVTLDRATASRLSEDPSLSSTIRGLLKSRLESSRVTSLAKLNRVGKMASTDGRLRFSLRFCATHTGRWGGQGLQPHNMPKSRLGKQQDAFLDAVRAHDIDELESLSPNVMQGLSWCLRAVLAAPAGFELLGADYSAIEARVLAWLAGQEDVLDVFRAGHDIYVEDAAKVGSDDRQLGKVQRLGLGYGMGPKKFITAAALYGVALTRKRSREIVRAWRQNNPRIVEFWGALESAMATVVRGEKQRVGVGSLEVIGGKNCVRIKLPSGRCLHYWKPRIVITTRRIESIDEEGNEVVHERTGPELQFFSVDKTKNAMGLDSTYGAKLAENVTQAVARDLLGDALVRFEMDTSYRVVLHVHDSIVAEVAAGAGDVENFCALMAQTPPWAEGLPIETEGYRSCYFKG